MGSICPSTCRARWRSPASCSSIRARRRGSERRIVYRVVDEFGSEFDFSPRSSRQPLSDGELARLIDTLRNTTNPVEGLGYTVESRFYVTIGEHFRAS